jgi:protein SCO1/2
MKWLPSLILLECVLAFALGCVPCGAQAVDASRTPRLTVSATKRSMASYQLPDVNLTRSDGRNVSLRGELDDGRPVFLNFIFTSCEGICPLMSQTFAYLQTKLGAERIRVHMVSISIDPEEDTPPRLAEYAERFHAGSQWQHYTGTVDSSRAVQRAFGVYGGDKMNHDPVTFLRAGPASPWIRIDGFTTADDLLREYHSLSGGG